MNKVSLDKIIRKIIYPRYPYVVDHEIDVHTDDGDASWGIERSTGYRVDLYVGTEETEGVDMKELLKTMDSARKMVMQLFEVLGPDKHETISVHYSLNEYRK